MPPKAAYLLNALRYLLTAAALAEAEARRARLEARGPARLPRRRR